MNIKNLTLMLLVLITNLAPGFAMDIEPKMPVGSNQISIFAALPIDVLDKILHFVSLENPRALNDLGSIQRVCKSLKEILSESHMLYQELLIQLNKVNRPDPEDSDLKKTQCLIKLGAHANITSILRGLELDRYQHGLDLILLLFNPHTDVNGSTLLFFLVANRNNANALAFLFNNRKEETAKVLKQLDTTSTTSLLAHAESEQVAKILLDAGCKLFVNCPESGIASFNSLVENAVGTKNPSPLIAVLKPNYTLVTATAIALALIAGASTASAIGKTL